MLAAYTRQAESGARQLSTATGQPSVLQKPDILIGALNSTTV